MDSNTIEQIKKSLIEKTKGMTAEQVQAFYFDNNLVDYKIGQIGLIRKRFFYLLKESPQDKIETVKQTIERELNTDRANVDASIYYHKRVNFLD